MNPTWRSIVSEQFEAAIDMLEQAVRNCPDDLWQGRMWNDPSMPPEFSEFWYVAFHTLFWLDDYLSGNSADFVPPPPFTLNELDPAGLLPERVYTRAELLAYLDHGRARCRATLQSLSEERAFQMLPMRWGEMPFAGLILDTMRHVQEHAAQLNLYLGQQTGANSRWVASPQS